MKWRELRIILMRQGPKPKGQVWVPMNCRTLRWRSGWHWFIILIPWRVQAAMKNL